MAKRSHVFPIEVRIDCRKTLLDAKQAIRNGFISDNFLLACSRLDGCQLIGADSAGLHVPDALHTPLREAAFAGNARKDHLEGFTKR